MKGTYYRCSGDFKQFLTPLSNFIIKFENVCEKNTEYKRPKWISDYLINKHPSQKSPSPKKV